LTVNINVMLWLLAGGLAASLMMLQEHSSFPVIVGSFIAAPMLVWLFNMMRRQPKR
jgi:hypothetical protein